MSPRKIKSLQDKIVERSLRKQDREEERQALCDRLRTDLDPVARVKEERALEQLEAAIDQLDDELDDLEAKLKKLQASEGLSNQAIEGLSNIEQPYESPAQVLFGILRDTGVVLGGAVVQQSFEWVVQPGGYGGTRPQGLGEVLGTLADLVGDRAYGERDAALVKWVVFMLAQEGLVWPKEGREQLRQWGQARLPELDQKVEALRQEQQRSIPASQRRSALLVWVRASRNNSQRYQVSAWAVEDLSRYKPQSFTGLQPLEPLSNREPDLTPAELPELVKHYFHQCQRLPLGELSLEVFLPLDLLNLALNHWSCTLFGEDTPLVCYRPVNLRSSERLTSDYCFLWNQWRDRWQQVETQSQNPAQEVFQWGNCQNLNAQVADRRVVAMKLAEKPDPKVFPYFLRYAIPVVLWMRENLAILPYQKSEIQDILTCALKEVPDAVWRKRQETQHPDHGDPGSHIGHHLALLWENPHLVPPNPEFNYPIS